MPKAKFVCGDALEELGKLPDQSVHCCVTSPPYFGLRDYGTDGQIGLEPTPAEYVAKLVEIFREVRRVLRDDGTFWLNLGDSYSRETSSGARATMRRYIRASWRLRSRARTSRHWAIASSARPRV